MNKIIVLVTLVITLSSIASAIEVGGHLTEDTIWSPGNNPYLVTENLYVDSGVTLTILPGTEIRINAAPCTTSMEFSQYFWLPDNEAKMIWVDGRIIAEGTEQANIIFTKMQNDTDYCWATISISAQADLCTFKYCTFEYGAGLGIALGNTDRGTVTINNGKGVFNNCLFNNNGVGLDTDYTLIKALEITECQFSFDSTNSFLENHWINCHLTLSTFEEGYQPALLANNRFINGRRIYACSVNCFSNVFIGSPTFHTGDPLFDYSNSYFFNNDFNNCYTGIESTDENPIYIKNNRFIGGHFAIDILLAYVEISDNFLTGCDIITKFSTSGIIKNNINNGGAIYAPGITNFQNNISYGNDSGIGICATFQRLACANNVSINNQFAFEASHSFDNCIFIGNEELEQFSVTGNPIFRNCITDFPLDPPLVDGGGNIIVDSLQAQEIFVDIENGEFHLAPGSIAIDAGFDTLGYYYPFDLGNSERVWDGDGDGNAIIDIGAYEYGAPQLGKITGYITETISGETVDYVLLKANNEPGEFTFADSSGYFEFQLPEGTYDLYAERVFYEDNIIYTVTVENEQTTEIEFNMTYNDPLVGIEDNELIINNSELIIFNYPNPFNPTTIISFNLPSDSDVSVEVYNVKGQKVKTLLNEKMTAGQHKVIWNGLNEKNKPVSSGVYLYKVRAGNQESVKRMILLK